jgi:hypothetical protein
MNRRSLHAVAALALAAIGVPCFAQDDAAGDGAAGLWAIGLASQVDEDGNDSLLVNLNWGVTPSTWLSFAAGRSRSPADRADVSADTLVAAVDHRFDAVGVTFEVEDWGDSGALETQDLRASVYVARERFRVGVAFEDRDIEIPFTLTGPFGGTLRRTAETSADGVALDFRIEPADRWQLYFSAVEYDYENDLAVLPRIERLNLLSTSTLTLANSFVDHLRMVGVERELGRTLLNVTFTSDESAVDGSEFETLEAGLMFPVAARLDLEVTLGNGRSDFFGSGLYAGLSLLIYGR